MKVSEVMTPSPFVLHADETVDHAARQLRGKNVGMMPVQKEDRMIGVLTDRDIVTRVIAEGLAPAKTRVGSIVSESPKYCFDDDECDHVARNMDELLVRRLPVLNRRKRLVGMVSIDDIRPRKAA